MTKYHFQIFLALLCLNVNSQNWTFSGVLKGSSIESKSSVIDDQNNQYVLSFFTDTIYSPYSIVSRGSRDLALVKIDAEGVIQWIKTIGSKGLEAAGGISIDGDNNIFVTGMFYNNCYFSATDSLVASGTTGDIFLAKYNSGGNLSWAKKVSSSFKYESALDLKYTNNKLLICGAFNDSLVIGSGSGKTTLLANGITANFIASFDEDGNLQWAKRYLGTRSQTRFTRIDESQNGYYVGGYFQGSLYLDIDTITSMVTTTFDAFIYKIDLDGDGQWIRCIKGSGTENFKTLTTDEYDNVYILGNYSSALIYVDSTASVTKILSGNSGGYDTFIGKYNRSGVLQWLLRKGSTAEDIYTDFVIRNNIIYSTGYFTNQIIFNEDTLRTDNSLNQDPFLAAFNEIGDPIDAISIQGTGNYNDAGTSVRMGSDSRAYLSGYYRSQQIKIGGNTYTSNNINKSDLFFAVYEHPFTAVITAEKMISCHGLSDGMLRSTPYFGTPPYTYSWSHNPSLNSPVADGLGPGTYTVTITDNLGHHDHSTAVITEPLPISISGTIDSVSCFNMEDGAIDASVSGGTVAGQYHYYWTSLDGSGVEPQAQNQDGLSEGHYNLEVHDDNMCTESEEFYVGQPGEFLFNGSAVTNITMPPGNNGAVDLEASGGNAPLSFNWSGPSGFAASSEDISGLSLAGLYAIIISDRKNCNSDTSFAVTDATTMIAQVTDKTNVTCFGLENGTATVTMTNGQPPYTYSWSDGIVIANSFRSGLAAGKHSVTVTDAAMHIAEDSVVIGGPLAPLTLVLDPEDLLCYEDNSGVVNLVVSGGTLPYTYNWDNGYTGEDLVNIPTGTYVVQVTDSKGCTGQGNAVVDQPDPMVIATETAGVNLCPEDNSVMATANVTGGFGAYTYLWDDPGAQITQTAYELSAGNYSVTVTDQHNCRDDAQVFVPAPHPFTVDEVDYTEPSCAGDSDGAIIPWITGGTGGYSYIWSNNVFVHVNSDIPAGTYTLTITDANNCHFTHEFTLDEPDTLKIAGVEITDLSCSGMPDGSITITPAGGTGAILYSIDGGLNYGSSPVISALEKGSYVIKITDSEDCESDTVNSTIEKSEECKLIIYDAFSPNGDSYNDTWEIGNMDEYPACRVNIFNTWGVLVFSSHGYGTPWDGKHNGRDLPSGTYYYMIDPGDGSGILTGPVSITY